MAFSICFLQFYFFHMTCERAFLRQSHGDHWSNIYFGLLTKCDRFREDPGISKIAWNKRKQSIIHASTHIYSEIFVFLALSLSLSLALLVNCFFGIFEKQRKLNSYSSIVIAMVCCCKAHASGVLSLLVWTFLQNILLVANLFVAERKTKFAYLLF